MPIDVDRVLGASLPETAESWDEDRVILYQIGVGAGVPATDPNELQYAYEADLKVLPSFVTIPAMSSIFGIGMVEGLTFNPILLVHGDQEVVTHRALPTSATVTQAGRIAEIWDKGKGALVVIEVVGRDASGDMLYTARAGLYLRGEGGFGGAPGPRPGDIAPDREPDLVVESPTLEQQALLYRLNGDKNPLHADPAVAAMAGFSRPILHGLCTYGIVCKAAVDGMFDGDVARVHAYRARFSRPVLPGQTILTSLWRQDDRVILRASVKETAEVVLTNASIR
ncbi:maoC like domain protein [bacterium BMS3Abin02]|nr:maoC like domain protein [bacterium BMS3Abin02]GBE22520.1 maoC like domain protein [bacterium BMS3Bbin01]HDL50106.1 3-alpha,7-alpha,12-alpha-trihydroxy-5-beta-cholest-24-enoyl-CoA hydratase [Actinomycetota bacterium]